MCIHHHVWYTFWLTGTDQTLTSEEQASSKCRCVTGFLYLDTVDESTAPLQVWPGSHTIAGTHVDGGEDRMHWFETCIILEASALMIHFINPTPSKDSRSYTQPGRYRCRLFFFYTFFFSSYFGGSFSNESCVVHAIVRNAMHRNRNKQTKKQLYVLPMFKGGHLDDAETLRTVNSTLVTVPAGSVALYNCRLLHRGTANTSPRARPTLYFSFVSRDGIRLVRVVQYECGVVIFINEVTNNKQTNNNGQSRYELYWERNRPSPTLTCPSSDDAYRFLQFARLTMDLTLKSRWASRMLTGRVVRVGSCLWPCL